MPGLSTLKPLVQAAFWRSKWSGWRARRFDRRYGTDTVTQVSVPHMADVAVDLARHAVHYEASAIPKFNRSIKAALRCADAPIEEYAFVDIGSGKGLVLMLASDYPFRSIIGIEMSAQLVAIARSNLSAYARRRKAASSVLLLCADAVEAPLPDGPLIVYLYNPFDAVMLARFAQRLAILAETQPLIVIYVNPAHATVVREAGFQTVCDAGTFSVFRSRMRGIERKAATA